MKENAMTTSTTSTPQGRLSRADIPNIVARLIKSDAYKSIVADERRAVLARRKATHERLQRELKPILAAQAEARRDADRLLALAEAAHSKYVEARDQLMTAETAKVNLRCAEQAARGRAHRELLATVDSRIGALYGFLVRLEEIARHSFRTAPNPNRRYEGQPIAHSNAAACNATTARLRAMLRRCDELVETAYDETLGTELRTMADEATALVNPLVGGAGLPVPPDLED
jgi:hypothetical protein